MKQKILIRDQPPGIFFNLLASIAIIVCLILLYQAFFTSDFTNDHGWKRWSVLLVSGLSIFTIGIRPVATQQLLIDLDKNTYKKGYRVGPVNIGKWKQLPQPDYVSIFRQPLKNGKFNYEMNLWYSEIHHIELFYFDDPQLGFETALNVATQLKVLLVDARTPNKTIEIPFKK